MRDVPGGWKRAARSETEQFCSAIVGVAHRASNEAVSIGKKSVEAATRLFGMARGKKGQGKERRRRRKFDASATISDLRATEAMVGRGDDDMRIAQKLSKGIAAPGSLPPTTSPHGAAPRRPRAGASRTTPRASFPTAPLGAVGAGDFAELPEADQRILAELISEVATKGTGSAGTPCPAAFLALFVQLISELCTPNPSAARRRPRRYTRRRRWRPPRSSRRPRRQRVIGSHRVPRALSEVRLDHVFFAMHE